MSSTIHTINISCQTFDLVKPYVLSFGTVAQLHSVQAEIILNDQTARKAETVPLPGYSDETKESIERYLTTVKPQLTGTSLEEARAIVEKDIKTNPFACSPLLTAIDLFNYKFTAVNISGIEFVIPATSTNLDELNAVLKTKPKTVKIKLSGDPGTDIKCVEWLEQFGIAATAIRFDANKAYTYDQAVLFYERLSNSPILNNVHYVEQPLGESYWEETGRLVKLFPKVNTMLDESIVTVEDLQHAMHIKIPFVKFKLFKQGGIKELLEQAETAFQNGISIVLGNGMATAMSNDIENAIYLQHKNKFFGASEANGFLKLR